jgi:PKD repeat protein
MAEDEKKKVEEKKPKKTKSTESGGINKKIIAIVAVVVVIIAIVAFVLLGGEEEENGDNGDDNNPPNAQIELIQENFYVNQIVFFNSTSYDIDGDTITHFWDFGDDSTSSDVNTTHTYDEAGLYNITLTITDEHGKETTDAINLTVKEIPSAELSVTVLTTSPLPPSYSVSVESIDIPISTDLVHFWVIDSDTLGSLSDGNVATAATGQYANVVFTDATETGILSAGDFFTVTDYPQGSQSHIGLEDGDIFKLTMEGNPDDLIVEEALE